MALKEACHLSAAILGPILDQNSPGIPNLELTEDLNKYWPLRKGAGLMSRLALGLREVLKMAHAHRNFVDAIRQRLPEYITIKDAQPRGIVMVGGGEFFPPMMVSLRLLRQAGTRLPVEVFVPDNESYEEELCEKILPSLGARCLILEDLLHPNASSYTPQIKLEGFQYKNIRHPILILLGTALARRGRLPLPQRDRALRVRALHVNRPSDLARLLGSFDITSLLPHLISTRRARIRARKHRVWPTPSVETEKLAHAPPSRVLQLLRPNALLHPAQPRRRRPGRQVDLPTRRFSPQPRLLPHKTTYRCRRPPERRRLGQLLENGSNPARPIEDYQLYSDRNTTLTPDEARSSDVTARAYFLHMTDPKWDAAEAFHHDGGFDLTQDDTGARAPAFRDPPEARDEIEGVERMVWEEMRLVGCELEFVTGHWREKEGVCERLERYFEEVLDTELGSEMGLGPLEEGLWPAG
ncbi:MAG: hypothetical protein MMC23_004819 [Stictis urceolatum]|nr:hypothetical protein [Stictis urceolata]